MSEIEKPFASLGSHLRTVREQSKRSLAEVSGAVEIDEFQLELIEAGKQRPEEDVMLLLISYFNVQDQEALHLWELAQYDSDLSEHIQLEQAAATIDTAHAAPGGKPMVMLLAVDVRTMYSDSVDVHATQAGLTIQFNQITPKSATETPVARIGMSHSQAEEVIRALQQGLLKARYDTGPRLLPPPKQID